MTKGQPGLAAVLGIVAAATMFLLARYTDIASATVVVSVLTVAIIIASAVGIHDRRRMQGGHH